MSDAFANMDASILALIGDDLTYCPNGGAPIAPPFRAWVAYTQLDVGFDGYTANVDEPSLQVRVSDVPTPTRFDIITLPKTGTSYSPRDWKMMPNGEFWSIALRLT
jgi:hypothetical protein